MKLNNGQSIALQLMLTWWKYRTKQVFEISGAAGTGKTSLVRSLIEHIGLSDDEVLFMAYIGKATLALSRTGLNAKTIHSSICDVEMKAKTDEHGEPIVTKNNKYVWIPTFIRKEHLDGNIKLIVVDESAMVPESLANWILAYDIPVIALGDLNQLPPVSGKSFFLKNPDVILTEIMRQSTESPIPWLAKSILEGQSLREGVIDDKIFIVKKEKYDKAVLDHSDIVICGTNKTRDKINSFIRTNLKHIESPDPIIGDKMICRQNDWNRVIGDNIYLINGMVGYITDIDYEMTTKYSMKIDFRPEFLQESYLNLQLDRIYLKLPANKRLEYNSRINKFEFGYAITCHLSQGSQYNSVIVYNEPFGPDRFRRQWLYTAVTRAIDKLFIII